MEMIEVPKTGDFDTTYINEPLVQEWLEHVHKDNAKQLKVLEDGKEFNLPYMAVPLAVIKTIFVITGQFGLGANTRYLTVHLFDKFMSNHFCELYLTESGTDPDEASWSHVSKTISVQSKLRIMSCVQLASKMDSHSKGLGISQVMRTLRWLDDKSEYTRSLIYASEFYVYKTLDFKIPLFTPLHCVEILLAATKLGERTPEIYNVCVNLLDVAYLQHDRIYSHLQFLNPRRKIMALESNMLYLAAAVILCSIFILSPKESDAIHVVQTLSNLYGDSKSDGTTITLTQSDKWMKQAKIFADKKITTTDTAIAFTKLKQKNVGLSDYNKFVKDVAASKGINPKDIFDKMTNCGPPGSTNTTQAVNSSAVDRLTDTSKYTGAHKERFDESGKGRGAAGRSDATTNDGYVQGYQHKDTYDETHKET